MFAVALFSGSVVAQSGDCSLCELVVGFAERWVAENSTEVSIEHDLGIVCALLPSADQAVCNQMVSSELPAIVNYLEQEYDAATVCTMIGVCTSTVKPAATSGEYCAVCEFVMGYVEGYLAENQTEAQIERSLDAICALAPSTYAAICDQVVATYLPAMIQYIENNENPDQFCTQVGLCSSTEIGRASCRERV